MVGAVIQRWLSGHWLHGDVIAGFGHLHDHHDELHGDWSDERNLLHVHGCGDEQGWYWFCVFGISGGCSGDGSGCADLGVGCVR